MLQQILLVKVLRQATTITIITTTTNNVNIIKRVKRLPLSATCSYVRVITVDQLVPFAPSLVNHRTLCVTDEAV